MHMERKLNVKNNAGFTLVELMVVVAIIGILATLAVPQYKKFQAKSRQSEARLSLGGVYTIEQSFAAENSSYTQCLGQAGYNRDGVKFYYTVGFSADGANCGPNGALSCLRTSWIFLPATQVYSDTAASGSVACTSTEANTDIFLATAAENSALLTGITATTGRTKLSSTANAGGSAGTALTQQTFTVGASGSILTAGGALALTNGYDGWTIDQNKQLKNTQSGLR
jgi:type IV pilus assembly protein PilA